MDQSLEAFSRFTRVFESDEIIFSEYEPGDTFYVIQSGRVKLLKNEGESERSLDILQPPEMFGEMAILEGSPRSATAIAVDEVKALEFNAQNFELLMTGNPQIGINLLRIFAKRIYDSKRRFMILTLPSPQLKVADAFLMLDETLPDIDRETDTREFQTTIEDIAHWAGVSVTEAREILHNFVVQNRLEMYATRMVVKNINDFARVVSYKRKQAKNPTGIKT
jgi:CRP/FNR family transcriptional regulator, cyclic AMP receptor protein